MTRRSFIRVLASIGAVAVTYPLLNSIPEKDYYPEVSYTKEYPEGKNAILHVISGKNKNGDVWNVCDFSYDNILPKQTYDMMMKILIEKIA